MAANPALFEPAAEGGYGVTFPDFGYGGTQGDTIDEAHEMAEDLLKFLLSRTMKERRPIPPPGKTRGRNVRAVRLPALVAAKIELYNAMQKQGVRKSELARRVRQPKQQIERLLDLRHASRLDQLEAAFGALNTAFDRGSRRRSILPAAEDRRPPADGRRDKETIPIAGAGGTRGFRSGRKRRAHRRRLGRRLVPLVDAASRPGL